MQEQNNRSSSQRKQNPKMCRSPEYLNRQRSGLFRPQRGWRLRRMTQDISSYSQILGQLSKNLVLHNHLLVITRLVPGGVYKNV